MADEADGGDLRGALPELDLLAPATWKARHVTDWRLLRAGPFPVARSRVPVDIGDAAWRDWLSQVLASPAVAPALAEALARSLVRVLPQGASPGVAGAVQAARRAGVAAVESLPSLTLAICTRGRPDFARRALSAAVRLAGDGVDLLMVDGSPPGDPEAVALRHEFPGVRYVTEAQGGLDRARNLALADSQAEIVAFTDDDTVVGAGYAGAIRHAFAALPEAAVVCGLVEPLYPASEGSAAVEAYRGLARGYRRRIAARIPAPPDTERGTPRSGSPFLMMASTLGSGASLAVRRAVASRIGGFDTALDAGTAAAAGGDVEFLFRALKAGHAVCYDPAVWLRHEHRSSRAAAREQAEAWGTGFGAYLARTAAAYAEERHGVRLARVLLFAHYGWRAIRSLGDRGIPRDLLVRNVRGFLRGAGRYREAARHAPPPAAPRAPAVPALPDHAARLDLRQPIPTLELAAGATVVLTARLDGETLGAIRLPSVNGFVGRGRIEQAVIERFGERLLGVPAGRAGAALLEAVAGAGA